MCKVLAFVENDLGYNFSKLILLPYPIMYQLGEVFILNKN